MSAIGTWLGGGGWVAAATVGLVAAYAIKRLVWRKARCSTESELEHP